MCCSRRKDYVDCKFRKPSYFFRSCLADDKYLTFSKSSNGDPGLQICQFKGDKGQQFVIKPRGPDYLIMCKKEKLYLTLDSPQNGARFTMNCMNDGASQRYRLTQISPGSNKYIIHTHFGKVLDISNKNVENGAVVTQYDYTGKSNQLWILESCNNKQSLSEDGE